jgi:hypothetical protein
MPYTVDHPAYDKIFGCRKKQLVFLARGQGFAVIRPAKRYMSSVDNYPAGK